MKYFTKEWYETMQKTDLHLLLKVSSKADTFSERYFHEIYQQEESKWIQLQQEVASIQFEDLYPGELDLNQPYEDSVPSEEQRILHQKVVETIERARAHLASRKPFDARQEKKNFRKTFRQSIAHLKQYLPSDILEMVADIRVLALDHAAPNVKRKITAYCRENRKAVDKAAKMYRAETKKNFAHRIPAFMKFVTLHDCRIRSSQKRGKDRIITLDNSGGFTSIDRIVLKNCTVIKQDQRISGAWWLYDEIYPTKTGYELHALLQKDDLIDFTVGITDIEWS